MEDTLSLMTIEEYAKYEKKIPRFLYDLDYSWRLRQDPKKKLYTSTGELVKGQPYAYETNSSSLTPTYHSELFTYITFSQPQTEPIIRSYLLRPVLRTSLQNDRYSDGDIEVFLNHPFFHLDENFWLAEVPLGAWLNSWTDSDYMSSSIRSYLCDISQNKKITAPNYSKQTLNPDEDDLFNLSLEEYEAYKNLIPAVPFNWYLRTPCSRLGGSYREPEEYYGVKIVTYEDNEPDVQYVGEHYQFIFNKWTRPALRTRFANDNYHNGDIEVFYKFPFVHIDRNLWIAKFPISLHFGMRKDRQYTYKESPIRNGIINWKKNRDSLPADHYINTEFLAENRNHILIP